MNRKSKLVLLLSLFVCIGCSSISNRQPAPANVADGEPKASVTIGGFVKLPQEIVIPAGGLTLLEAMTRSGISLNGESLLEPSDGLVTLRRSTAIGPQTFYFPYSLVQFSLTGDIRLQDQDVVLLVGAADLQLDQQIPGSEDRFAVTGMVENPGTYTIDTDSNTFSDLENYVGQVDRNANIAVLTRRSLSGLGVQHFVIPTGFGGAQFANVNLLRMKLQSGDVVNHTRLERIPIVLAGMIENFRESTDEKSGERLSRRKQLQQSQLKTRRWLTNLPNSLRIN